MYCFYVMFLCPAEIYLLSLLHIIFVDYKLLKRPRGVLCIKYSRLSSHIAEHGQFLQITGFRYSHRSRLTGLSSNGSIFEYPSLDSHTHGRTRHFIFVSLLVIYLLLNAKVRIRSSFWSFECFAMIVFSFLFLCRLLIRNRRVFPEQRRG